MKKLLLTLLLASTIGYAQFNVTDLQGNVVANGTELVFNTFNTEAAKFKFKTVNTSNADIDIRVRCTGLTNSDGVGFQLCYGGLCHDNVVVGAVYPDFQNIIAPGQDNGPADYFVNNVPGVGDQDLIYTFEIYALDMSGFPIGELFNLSYRYSPTLSLNGYEQLSNLGVNLKNTISTDLFDFQTTTSGKVDVISLTGQKLMSQNFQVGNFTLNLGNLNTSYYLLVFSTNSGASAAVKVLKK
jgi:hypothetical protein